MSAKGVKKADSVSFSDRPHPKEDIHRKAAVCGKASLVALFAFFGGILLSVIMSAVIVRKPDSR